VHVRPGRSAVLIPTHGGLNLIGMGRPRLRFPIIRRDLARIFLDELRAAAPAAHDLTGGRLPPDGRLVGTADLPNFCRQSSGPGWALVGDAGCHKGPTAAHGIADAL